MMNRSIVAVVLMIVVLVMIVLAMVDIVIPTQNRYSICIRAVISALARRIGALDTPNQFNDEDSNINDRHSG